MAKRKRTNYDLSVVLLRFWIEGLGPRKLTIKWCKILASGHFLGDK
jgi:hypothetical protein